MEYLWHFGLKLVQRCDEPPEKLWNPFETLENKIKTVRTKASFRGKQPKETFDQVWAVRKRASLRWKQQSLPTVSKTVPCFKWETSKILASRGRIYGIGHRIDYLTSSTVSKINEKSQFCRDVKICKHSPVHCRSNHLVRSGSNHIDILLPHIQLLRAYMLEMRHLPSSKFTSGNEDSSKTNCVLKIGLKVIAFCALKWGLFSFSLTLLCLSCNDCIHACSSTDHCSSDVIICICNWKRRKPETISTPLTILEFFHLLIETAH